MTILTEKTTWRRRREIWDMANPGKLSTEQEANVRAALMFLKRKFGTWEKLGKAMGMHAATVHQNSYRLRRPPNSGVAIRAARVACVPVERILSGLWPPPNACPYCGRG